ncbi:hypothetical protein BDW02DRAFT_553766 [Decorospora gaudefroyi]|uniref:Uncharacterized protein n=1 Tax=Decorospora gaudefroyi TaxID=184978 RepID=A0A6A5K5B8_9PLEO|nr:hypothetical protein BDW02DRAFT_553766 [Decorospora gaudefroyi]
MRITPVLVAAAFVAGSHGRALHGPFDATDNSEPTRVQKAALVYDPQNVASNADWATYTEKGARLGCRLDADDEAAGRLWMDTRNPPSARSEWSNVKLMHELGLWYWHQADFDQDYHCNFADDDSNDHTNKIGSALQALGLSSKPKTQGGDNVCFNIEHFDDDAQDDDGDQLEPEDQYYEVNGREYQATGAHVRFGVNQPGGMIIGMDFQSPRAQAVDRWQEEPTEDELPRLKRVSDIMTAFWLRGHGNPKNLRYYLAFNVQNDETVPLIARVLKNRGHDKMVPYWPGVTVGTWEKEGEALLGSPIGSTLAFLLAQHKAELGHKHVTDITIFKDNYPPNTIPSVQLLYRIQDVPKPEQNANNALQARSKVMHTGPKHIIRIHKLDADTY